jgi:hypothetical protein
MPVTSALGNTGDAGKFGVGRHRRCRDRSCRGHFGRGCSRLQPNGEPHPYRRLSEIKILESSPTWTYNGWSTVYNSCGSAFSPVHHGEDAFRVKPKALARCEYQRYDWYLADHSVFRMSMKVSRSHVQPQRMLLSSRLLCRSFRPRSAPRIQPGDPNIRRGCAGWKAAGRELSTGSRTRRPLFCRILTWRYWRRNRGTSQMISRLPRR